MQKFENKLFTLQENLKKYALMKKKSLIGRIGSWVLTFCQPWNFFLADVSILKEVNENQDCNAVTDPDEEDWNLFKLLRSYSLPNLYTTPVENLFATSPDEVTEPSIEEVRPIVTFEDEENEDQVSISSTFYVQLLGSYIPKA